MAETAIEMPLKNTLVIGGKAVDGRTIPAKRYKALCSELASDLGEPTSAQWSLIARAAGITVQCELIEAQIAQGEAVSVGDYTRLINTLIGTLRLLGVKHRAGDRLKTLDPHARLMSEIDDDDD